MDKIENVNGLERSEGLKDLWQQLANYFSNRTQEDIERDRQEEEKRAFLSLVDQAKSDWERAKNYFEEVTNPELIDLAIHRMEAAKIFYMYLLKEAKRKGSRYRKIIHKIHPDLIVCIYMDNGGWGDGYGVEMEVILAYALDWLSYIVGYGLYKVLRKPLRWIGILLFNGIVGIAPSCHQFYWGLL